MLNEQPHQTRQAVLIYGHKAAKQPPLFRPPQLQAPITMWCIRWLDVLVPQQLEL